MSVAPRPRTPLLAIILATWFGCGYAPAAPGTAGALGAILAAAIVFHFFPWPPAIVLIAVALLAWPSIRASRIVAGSAGHKDPALVVVDEVLGQWVTVAGATAWNWKSALGAFFLFRLFDIAKPWPIRRLESLPGGVGIVADDLLAGVYGALVLFLAGCFNLY